MAELCPYPLGALVRRSFRELEQHDAIFDLPAKKFFLGRADRDYGVHFHHHAASSPLGPAAGPHTQMAQNIVLAWLAGCRIMELKTVQILDELEIPRPCIDMQTVGYNVEWSQELKLEQSLDEYVKAAMLIEMLRASGKLELADGCDTVFDLSVGYDLAGIKTARVQAFLDGMMDATAAVERLRAEIPDEFAQFRSLAFPTRLSDTLTLSTFHGCPPHEIESIIQHLLVDKRLSCIIKLNPTLLGPEVARGLLNDQLGYTDVHIPDSAFANDAKWEQAVEFVGRLGDLAASEGLGFGVKFSNTLLVENHRDFFPGQKEMYMSGTALHVLAMNLVKRFRATFGDRFPISFAAGIDRDNFSDAVALGLAPITVCSDLLQPGGYGRTQRFYNALDKVMDQAGANSLGDYVIRAYGKGEEALQRLGLPAGHAAAAAGRAILQQGGDLKAALASTGLDDAAALYDRWVSEAKLLNTPHYVDQATADVRYSAAKNSKPPKKQDTHLELFDCLSCNKCVPVCPNNANFTYTLPALDVPVLKLYRDGRRWASREEGRLVVAKTEQYANLADFCNECGNCDIFCPELGGPYVLKPRFFGSLASYERFRERDGFFLSGSPEAGTVHARFDGVDYRAVLGDGRAQFSGPDFAVTFKIEDPAATVDGESAGLVDLGKFDLMRWMLNAVLDPAQVNYLNAL